MPAFICIVCTKSLSLSVFEIFDPKYPCAHTQKHAASDHGLCGVSDEPCQWKMANFDPPQLRRFLTDRSESQILETRPGATQHAKYDADRNKGVGGANAQFVTILLVLPFVFLVCVLFAPRPGHTAGPISTRDGS